MKLKLDSNEEFWNNLSKVNFTSPDNFIFKKHKLKIKNGSVLQVLECFCRPCMQNDFDKLLQLVFYQPNP